MATIRLIRTNEFNNRMRDYKIFIDGHQVGTIANGETKEFPAPAGKHTVIAKIDWCSSPQISIDLHENQTKNLQVGGFVNGQFLMPMLFGIILLHSAFSIFAEFEYFKYLVVPVFILLFYNITLGRKAYLTITEVNDR
jgi:hypothetical protein